MGKKRSDKKPPGFTLPASLRPAPPCRPLPLIITFCETALFCRTITACKRLRFCSAKRLPFLQAALPRLANDCDSAPKMAAGRFYPAADFIMHSEAAYANRGQKPCFYPVTGFIAVSSFSRRFSSPPRKTARYRHDKHKLTR